MKLRSFVPIVLVPVTCLVLKPFDPIIDRWLATAYRAGIMIFFQAVLVGAVLAIAGVFLEITIKGMRKNRPHPHQASHPADHRVT